MARHLRVGTNRIYEWESGRKIPRRGHLEQLAQAMDIGATALLVLRVAARVDRIFRVGESSLEALHERVVAAIEGEADLRARGSE